jgi:hypothetical protein
LNTDRRYNCGVLGGLSEREPSERFAASHEAKAVPRPGVLGAAIKDSTPLGAVGNGNQEVDGEAIDQGKDDAPYREEVDLPKVDQEARPITAARSRRLVRDAPGNTTRKAGRDWRQLRTGLNCFLARRVPGNSVHFVQRRRWAAFGKPGIPLDGAREADRRRSMILGRLQPFTIPPIRYMIFDLVSTI